MRRWLLVSVFTLPPLLAAHAPAAADSLSATREQDVTETKHTVDVEVKDGLAYYKVRRVFHNAGKVADEARLEINLPFGAVATGLRIKGKSQWHEGELMHARKAEELYIELTGMGPSEPKDPALLYWRWTDELALRVFPIFPGKSNTVEYTLTAPTTYADGTYHLTYSRKPEAKNMATPLLRLGGKNIEGFEIDGEASKRTVRLAPVRLHPVLVKSGIDNPKVLVRTIEVRGEEPWEKASISVNIRHTWRGDVELAIVAPDGTLRSLRDEDLSDGDNDLKTSFPLEYKGDPNGTWHLLVTDHHPLDGGTLKQWSLRSSTPSSRVFRDAKPAFIPQPTESRAGLATLGVRFKAEESVVRLGRVDLLRDKQFARFEVDVAERLSKLPRPLSVSFVVDVSHTMDQEGIAAQLKLAEAYLAHVPWAEFSIVAFGRRGHRLTRGFVPARQLAVQRARLLEAGELDPRNGSFLDRGLELAVPDLAKRKGTRALVMMTDDRLRPAWKNAGALAELAKLPTDAVVHVASISTGGAFALERDDKHRLFPLAKLRGGVAVDVSGILEAKLSALAEDTVYLVRPNRLDHVSIEGLGDKGDAVLESNDTGEAKDVLVEGSGLRWIGAIADAPERASVTGQLWSRPVRYEGRSDDEPFNKATAGFVFSHDLHGDLEETEQFVLATYARVVSPVTSYLAIEPGVRPSTIGLEGGGAGWGSIGTGSYGSIGHGGGGAPAMQWKPIVDRVTRACRSHGAGSVDAHLRLQSHEIADIEVKRSSKNKALQTCLIEALWAETIPPMASHPSDWSKLLQLEVGR